jgi:tetratricopeptide (TPR) repeat protein
MTEKQSEAPAINDVPKKNLTEAEYNQHLVVAGEMIDRYEIPTAEMLLKQALPSHQLYLSSDLPYFFSLCAEQYMEQHLEPEALRCRLFAKECGGSLEDQESLALTLMDIGLLSLAYKIMEKILQPSKSAKHEIIKACDAPWAPYLDREIAKRLQPKEKHIHPDITGLIKSYYPHNDTSSLASREGLICFLLSQPFKYLINKCHPKLIPILLCNTADEQADSLADYGLSIDRLKNLLTFLSERPIEDLLENDCTDLIISALNDMGSKKLTHPEFLETTVKYCIARTMSLTTTNNTAYLEVASYLIDNIFPQNKQARMQRYTGMIHRLNNRQNPKKPTQFRNKAIKSESSKFFPTDQNKQKQQIHSQQETLRSIMDTVSNRFSKKTGCKTAHNNNIIIDLLLLIRDAIKNNRFEQLITTGKQWLLHYSRKKFSSNERITNAFKCFGRAQAIEPRNPKLAAAYYQMGILLEARKETASAILAYKETNSINPNDPRPLFALCKIYIDSQRTDKAKRSLEQALAIPEQNRAHLASHQTITEYWFAIASDLAKKEMAYEAAKAYLQLLHYLKKQNTNTPITQQAFKTYITSATHMINAEEIFIAEAFLQEALRHPNLSHDQSTKIAYLFSLCGKEYMSHQYELKSIECYEIAIKYTNNPQEKKKYLEAHADTLHEIGLLSQAEKAFQQIVLNNPGEYRYPNKKLHEIKQTRHEPWVPYLNIAVAKAMTNDRWSININSIESDYQQIDINANPATKEILDFLLGQPFSYLLNGIHPKLIPLLLRNITQKPCDLSDIRTHRKYRLNNLLALLANQPIEELLKHNCSYLMIFAFESMRDKNLSHHAFLKKAIFYFINRTRELVSSKKMSDFETIDHIIKNTYNHVRKNSYTQIMAARYGEIVNYLIANKKYETARSYCQKMLRLRPKEINLILASKPPKKLTEEQKKALLSIYNDCLQYCKHTSITVARALRHQSFLIEPKNLTFKINDAELVFIWENDHSKLSAKLSAILANPDLKKIKGEQQEQLFNIYDNHIQYYCDKKDFDKAISLCEQAIQSNIDISNYYRLRKHEISCQRDKISPRDGRTCSRIFEEQRLQERPKPDSAAFDDTQTTPAYFDKQSSRQALSPMKNNKGPKKPKPKHKTNSGEEKTRLAPRKLF